jgi:hypothetical protein
MNRHARRAAAARARRGVRPGYLHRILSADLALRPGVHIAAIEHDRGCAIYRGGDCDCVPDISMSSADSGDVTIVDERGQARRVSKQ